MRRSRYAAVTVLVALAALVSLAACGGDEKPSEASSAPDATTSDAPAPSEDARATEGDAGDDGDANADAHADAADAATDAADADAGSSPAVVGYQILGEVAYPFARPYALAVDSKDHLFVSEQTDAPDTHTLYLTNRSYATNIAPGHARILEIDAAGAYVGWIGYGSDGTPGFHDTESMATAVYGYDSGYFNMIRGMTFDAADHLYVLDNWRIQELDETKAFVRWAGYGFLNGGFGWHTTGHSDWYAGPQIGGVASPSCLRIHGDRLWLGTWYWNYPGFTNGQWNNIGALDMATGLGVGWLGGAINTSTAATSTGYFAVGAPLEPRSSVAHTVSPGFFSSPRHFAWHGDRIYVVDNTSDPVLTIFDENGVIQPGRLSHLAGVGAKPFAITVDRYGNVIVSDMYTGAVRFFTNTVEASGELHQAAVWQLDTPSTPNAVYPIISDFAWDSQDNLYVAATTKDKVYKIKLTY